MEIEMKNKFESLLLNPSQELINEIEKDIRICALKTLLRKYKIKNIVMYRKIQREYLALIK